MNDNVDLMWIPRINTVDGMTQEDIQKWASSSETIDKYKKRYGEEYQVELNDAVKKMEERLKVQSFKEYVKI